MKQSACTDKIHCRVASCSERPVGAIGFSATRGGLHQAALAVLSTEKNSRDISAAGLGGLKR